MASEFHLLTPLPISKVDKKTYDKDDIICDRYRILKTSGMESGHGRIFYCLDIWDDSPCVLKELPPHSRMEAENLATLPLHPNIVRLLRLEVIGGAIFIVQEWLPETLRDVLNKKAVITPDEILHISFSILAGLKHCIRFLSPQYAHGDLKPENVLISREWSVKIADFGGGYTPCYASPEQMAGHKPDVRSDIFSLGIILKELCSKCEDKSFKEKISTIIKQCIHDSPDNRLQSLQELHVLLSQLGAIPPAFCRIGDAETSNVLNVEQYCNLALIGKPFKLFHALNNILSSRPANDKDFGEKLYRIGDILMNMGQYSGATAMYTHATQHGEHALAWAGLARAYEALCDWDNAIRCSAKAIWLDKFDYRSFRVHINAIYNKNLDIMRSKGLSLDDILNQPPVVEIFSKTVSALEITYGQRPTQKEPLRLIGYIYYILGDYKKCASYYEEYLAHNKDDYETAFYFAMALYEDYETTKAKKYFQSVADTLENVKSGSRQRLLFLVYCAYFLEDVEKFISYRGQLEECISALSDSEQKNLWDLTLKYIVIDKMFQEDVILMEQYWGVLSDIGAILRLGETMDQAWYEEQIRVIQKCRMEWTGWDEWQGKNSDLTDSGEEEWGKWQKRGKPDIKTYIKPNSLSNAIRCLNTRAYSLEALIYTRMENYDAAIQSFDKALEWDHSLFEVLVNKAEILVHLDQFLEAIPLYRKAFEVQENKELRKDIKTREKWALICILEDKQRHNHFYQNLMEMAPGWNGDLTALNEALSTYGALFNDHIFFWLSEQADSLIENILTGRRAPGDIIPLLNFIGTLQRVKVPEPSELDKEQVSLKESNGTNLVYHTVGSHLTNLAEIAMRILNVLITAADKYHFPGWLFSCLPFRGLAYYEREWGDRSENLERALRDLLRTLEQPECSRQEAFPRLAMIYQNLGNIYTNRTYGDEEKNLASADYYFNKALELLTAMGTARDIAMNYLNHSVCFFKQRRQQEAADSAHKALNYFTINNEPVMFAKASHILGDVAAYYVGHGCNDFLASGIEALQDCLAVYQEGTYERNMALMKIAYLLLKKEAVYHDGSWVLAQYYYLEVPSRTIRDLFETLGIQDFLDLKFEEPAHNAIIERG